MKHRSKSLVCLAFPRGLVLRHYCGLHIIDIEDFVNSDVRYQAYADDVKVDKKISDQHDCLSLQKAAEQMAEWARLNFI